MCIDNADRKIEVMDLKNFGNTVGSVKKSKYVLRGHLKPCENLITKNSHI